MDLTRNLGRIWMILFGGFFTCFSLYALALGGLARHDATGTLIGLAMSAAGVWMVSGGLIGVRISPNHSVGGGPMYTRVRLEPGELVEQHAEGGHSSNESPNSKGEQSFFSESLTGELALTDRRLIFVPIRFLRFPAKPTWFAYNDVVAAEQTSRATLANLNGDSIRVETRDGASHFVVTRSPEMRRAVLALPSRRGSAPDVGSSLGADDEPVVLTIALSLAGGLGLAAFVFGQTSWPYVHAPDSWLFAGIAMLAAAVACWQIWRRMHAGSPNRSRTV